MRVSDTMNRTLSLIAAAVAVVGVAGCGGGGGGNGGGGNPAVVAVNTLRTFQPGDSWKYSVTADIVMADSTPTIHLKDGSYTRAIGTYASTSQAVKAKALKANVVKSKVADVGLSLTENLSLSYYGGYGVNTNNVAHILLETDGVYQVSDTLDVDGNAEGADPFNTVNGLFYGQQQILPATFSDATGMASDDSYGANGVFTPGKPATDTTPAIPDNWTELHLNQEQFSLAVIGTEDVSTPVGAFATYKCTVTKHYVTQGVTVTGTEWWAPQLGTFVKANYTQNIPGVGTEHLAYTLQTMHLAPTAAG